MKVWQKVYLAVLILVLFTVNLGLFFASGFLYRQNLSQEESQAETECYFLSRNLARDFERMQENRQFRQEVMEKLLSSYKKSYKKKGVRVDLIRKGSYQTGIFREDGDTVAAFASVLPAPFEDYTLIYEKKLKGFDDRARQPVEEYPTGIFLCGNWNFSDSWDFFVSAFAKAVTSPFSFEFQGNVDCPGKGKIWGRNAWKGQGG